MQPNLNSNPTTTTTSDAGPERNWGGGHRSYSRCPRTQPFVKVGGALAPPPVSHGVGATDHYQ